MTSEKSPADTTVREKEFGLEELFFSRTNPGGIIRAGNGVFQRVSGFDWAKLSGAPHKIVRHPDMPSGVFWLAWDKLKRGEPVGAYVKNRASTGEYYWVFAVMMPIADGYISIRLKPTSAIFDTIKAEYAILRARELADGHDFTPEQSAQVLQERIKALGYQDYEAFMARAIKTEIDRRDDAMGKHDDRLESLERMVDAVDDIFDEANRLYDEFSRISLVPVNMRLQATRCEPSGGPISVISSNYSDLMVEALDYARRFTDFAHEVLTTINAGLFLMAAARLQREMVELFEIEARQDPALAAEAELLRTHYTTCGENARFGVRTIAEKSENFRTDCRQMNRFLCGLDITRVTCRIEKR